MANVVVNDFLAKYTQKKGEKFQIFLNKCLIVLIGGACIGFGYLSNALPGGIIEAALSINGIVGGPTFAMFSLGFLFPFVGVAGASVSLLSGTALCTWIYMGRIITEPPVRYTSINPLTESLDRNRTKQMEPAEYQYRSMYFSRWNSIPTTSRC